MAIESVKGFGVS